MKEKSFHLSLLYSLIDVASLKTINKSLEIHILLNLLFSNFKRLVQLDYNIKLIFNINT